MIKHILVLSTLFFGGCAIEDSFSKKQAKDKFANMCDRDTLYVCGDDVPTTADRHAPIDWLVYYTHDHMTRPLLYIYMTDQEQFGTDDYYTYMYREDGIRYGDCEDFAITMVEDNIKNGYLGEGEVRIMFGKLQGDYHSWVVITKRGIEYLFDNNYVHGRFKDWAYENNSYEELSTLYSY